MNTRTPRQERGQETRKRIMEAGLRLFSQKGYYHINSKDIAREASVSIGSFYAYFKDKKVLFKELLKEFFTAKFQEVYYEGCEEEPCDQEGFKESIRKFTENILAAGDRYPVAFHMEILHLSLREEDISYEYENYCEEEVSYLINVFTSFPAEMSQETLRTISGIIVRLMEAYLLVILKEEEPLLKEALKKSFSQAVYYAVEDHLPREFIESCINPQP